MSDELSPAEHAARLSRTYELARDLGAMGRELMNFAARADRAATRQDIDLLAEAAEDIIGVGSKFQTTYISMMAVRVRPKTSDPLHTPVSDNRMSV